MRLKSKLKKKIIGKTAVSAACALLLMMSGCTFIDENKPAGYPQELTPASEKQPASQETKPDEMPPDKDETKPEQSGKKPETQEPSSGVQASMVDFKVSYDSEGAKEKAVITGYDVAGNELWVYETPEDYLTELERLSEIVTTNDEYIFVEFGDVVALDLATGEKKWVNSDFMGASPIWTMDYEGSRLFLCGYYGPTLFVMDFDGNTINKIASEDEEYFWPSKIVFVNDNQVDITFDSNEMTKSFDPDGPDKQ